MPTQKQNEANRSNAQNSTGPKSPAGQAASSHNSLKHGLLASDLTILADPASRDAAAALLQDFNDFYLPSSPIERALIRQMAILQYRLEAAPALETGIFTHAAETRYRASLAESDTFGPEPQRSLRNQILGLVFANDCEGPNAIPKLIRYETALSNRFLKCVDRFLRSRQSGPNQPSEAQPSPKQSSDAQPSEAPPGQDETLSSYNDSSEIAEVLSPLNPELPNEPNSDLTPVESVPSEALREPPPAPAATPPPPPPLEPLSTHPPVQEGTPGPPRNPAVTSARPSHTGGAPNVLPR